MNARNESFKFWCTESLFPYLSRFGCKQTPRQILWDWDSILLWEDALSYRVSDVRKLVSFSSNLFIHFGCPSLKIFLCALSPRTWFLRAKHYALSPKQAPPAKPPHIRLQAAREFLATPRRNLFVFSRIQIVVAIGTIAVEQQIFVIKGEIPTPRQVSTGGAFWFVFSGLGYGLHLVLPLQCSSLECVTFQQGTVVGGPCTHQL